MKNTSKGYVLIYTEFKRGLKGPKGELIVSSVEEYVNFVLEFFTELFQYIQDFFASLFVSE